MIIDPSEYTPYSVLAVTPLEFFLLSADVRIIDHLFGFLPPDDLIILQRVSRRTSAAVAFYMTRAWSMETFLVPWFPRATVSDFLDRLNEWDAIVAGSAALRFLDRAAPYPGSDLDVYVPISGLLEFGRWIQQRGYNYVPRAAGPLLLFDVAAITLPARWMSKRKVYPPGYCDLSFSPMFEVFDFERVDIPVPSGKQPAHIQLIAVKGDAREHVLTFHSTNVMNFFTGSYVASLFPVSTFCDRVSWICRNVYLGGYRSSASMWRSKYEGRGFRVAEKWGPVSPPPEPTELDELRSMADCYTWIVPLAGTDTKKLREKLDLQDIVFELLTAERGPVRPGTACAFASAGEYDEEWPYGGTVETFAAFGV